MSRRRASVGAACTREELLKTREAQRQETMQRKQERLDTRNMRRKSHEDKNMGGFRRLFPTEERETALAPLFAAARELFARRTGVGRGRASSSSTAANTGAGQTDPPPNSNADPTTGGGNNGGSSSNAAQTQKPRRHSISTTHPSSTATAGAQQSGNPRM
eukprot:GHVU01186895.1.p1 GENE.GHVU01186895.1~~GHVU01186895.1.p1  ORF type:complete len:160 (+),score=25.62 GHVU01186895.1:148-627(+)